MGPPAPFAIMSFTGVVGREDKRPINRAMRPTLKRNAAAGYQNPMKIELLKCAEVLWPIVGLKKVRPVSDFFLLILVSETIRI